MENRNNLGQIIFGDNLDVLRGFDDDSFNLIYIDPPFNTGKTQARGSLSYEDTIDSYIEFIMPRLIQARRVLKPNGSIFFHIDFRESHHVRVLLDAVFGRDNFMNEIIWAYDYGGRSKSKWPSKHDSIFWYVMDKNNYTFNYDEMDRIPYMAPGLVGEAKAKAGKTPTDVWWHTIVHTRGHEKTGYPSQKPEGVIERIVKVHSNEGEWLLDFFAGSGTLGIVAGRNGRNFVLVDNNPSAIAVMKARLYKYL